MCAAIEQEQPAVKLCAHESVKAPNADSKIASEKSKDTGEPAKLVLLMTELLAVWCSKVEPVKDNVKGDLKFVLLV